MQELAAEHDHRPGPASLDKADAIARAAHLWIRSLYRKYETEEGERLAIAGGLVAGLCAKLDLEPRVTSLVAYVYALLDDQGSQALSISRLLSTWFQINRENSVST